MGMPEQAYSELYGAYSAGSLDPAFALMLETQSVLRPDVRSSVAMAEAMTGTLLEREAPVEMSSDAAARALLAIEALEVDTEQMRSAAMAAGRGVGEMLDLPEPLRTAALDAAGQTGWKKLGPGIQRLPIDLGTEAELELYRIEPGKRLPRHDHDGYELTLVVAGGYTDEAGHFGPGDLSLMQHGDVHQPVGDAGEPCYALAVRDAGLRFTGVFGLLQRIAGK